MVFRRLTTKTRRDIEGIIDRLSNGGPVSLSERIKLKKYATYIPFFSCKIAQALKNRESHGNT